MPVPVDAHAKSVGVQLEAFAHRREGTATASGLDLAVAEEVVPIDPGEVGAAEEPGGERSADPEAPADLRLQLVEVEIEVGLGEAEVLVDPIPGDLPPDRVARLLAAVRQSPSRRSRRRGRRWD